MGNFGVKFFQVSKIVGKQKTYILETSTDLNQWNTVQVIEAKRDKVSIKPEFDFRSGARFFRVVEQP